MANVITIDDFGTHVVNTSVQANYVVIAGTLEVTAGGVITGDAVAENVRATVELRGGTLVVNGGTITSHPASNPRFQAVVYVMGGQVYVNAGSVTANGGGVDRCSGILVGARDGSTVNVSGGQITGALSGAGIQTSWKSGNNSITISGGTVAGGSGGQVTGTGLFLTSGQMLNSVSITGGSILAGGSGNNWGVGIEVSDGGNLSMTGGTVMSGGNAAIRVDQQQNAFFNVSISGGTITGSSMFGSSLTVQAFPNVTAVTVSGGQFTGQWLLASGIASVQGTQLASANGMLTGTLANGQPINVPIWVQSGAQMAVQNG